MQGAPVHALAALPMLLMVLVSFAVSVGSIVAVVMLVIAAWRTMRAHESLARSAGEAVRLARMRILGPIDQTAITEDVGPDEG